MQRFLNGNFGKYCLFKISYVQYNKHSINSLATCYLFNIISNATYPCDNNYFSNELEKYYSGKMEKNTKIKVKKQISWLEIFFFWKPYYFYPNLGCSILFSFCSS